MNSSARHIQSNKFERFTVAQRVLSQVNGAKYMLNISICPDTVRADCSGYLHLFPPLLVVYTAVQNQSAAALTLLICWHAQVLCFINNQLSTDAILEIL